MPLGWALNSEHCQGMGWIQEDTSFDRHLLKSLQDGHCQVRRLWGLSLHSLVPVVGMGEALGLAWLTRIAWDSQPWPDPCIP